VSPKVSIVILNYNNPRVISKCLETLSITEGVPYEVVVVDNGSRSETINVLREYKEKGLIDTLVESPVNNYFSEGNNIGFRNTNPDSEFVLLLNSDVAFLRDDWLVKVLAWAEGTAVYWPTVWDFEPTKPRSGSRDIVSVGWSHDATVVPGNARPEGWCLLIRRSVWQDMSPDFPWHFGVEEMLGKMVRAGAKCGVLCNYATYLVHREGGSGKAHVDIVNRRKPDIPGWLSGLDIETLDFTLGESEHDSYLCW
jgi:GT2 family glycosyltransferase